MRTLDTRNKTITPPFNGHESQNLPARPSVFLDASPESGLRSSVAYSNRYFRIRHGLSIRMTIITANRYGSVNALSVQQTVAAAAAPLFAIVQQPTIRILTLIFRDPRRPFSPSPPHRFVPCSRQRPK